MYRILFQTGVSEDLFVISLIISSVLHSFYFCYKPFGDKKTWHAARSTCRSLGAELVSIHSMKEQSWVETTSDVWTGLNDLAVPGMFMWSNEHIVTFTYWAPGEPNNHDGFSEDCVEIFIFLQTGRWNDVSCTELNTYVCKMPKAHYPLPSVKPTMYGCPQVGPSFPVV
uniref:C-type lectin domain-containing protein n=1 Tax=Poecilia reticulata TaxID=8081 RepID=A0A3P9N6U5_POERE